MTYLGYAIDIDGDQRQVAFFVDALHGAFQAVDQGAKRVVLIRVEQPDNPGLRFTPLCVLTPPEAS